jgi:hypothetical protein
MATRRRRSGKPLLVASAGLVVSIGCGNHHPPGNLMAPPQVQVCVDADPPEAQVMIDGVAVGSDGCRPEYAGQVEITATAPGYEPYREQFTPKLQTFEEKETHGPDRHAIKLVKQP